MIIHKKNQDILAMECQAIIHQCNCFGVMGGGIAAKIREWFPIVAQTDKDEYEAALRWSNNEDRLGTFSTVEVAPNKFVYNLYSQYRYGVGNRHTDYEAFYNGLNAIRHSIEHLGYIKTAAIPFKIGCGLGGGNWRIILTMIEEIFKDSYITLYICEWS